MMPTIKTIWIDNDYQSFYLSNINTKSNNPILTKKIKRILLVVPTDLKKRKVFYYLVANHQAIEETPYKDWVGLPFGEFLKPSHNFGLRDLYEYRLELEDGLTVSSILGNDLYIEGSTESLLMGVLASFQVDPDTLPYLKTKQFYYVADGIIAASNQFADDVVGFVCSTPEFTNSFTNQV